MLTFYLILFPLIISIVVCIYFHRRYKKLLLSHKKDNQKILDDTKIKHAELRGQLQADLLQGLRTPIFMLIAPLKEVISTPELIPSAKLKLKLAYRNAQTLQDYFMRLQEAYHLEADQKYQIASYTATRLGNGVIRSSYELLNASNIELHYDKDKRIATEIWVDKRRIQFVLQSILSNVLHIMEYNGDLWFDIFLKSNAAKEYCVFSIKGKSKTHSDYDAADNNSPRENFLGWDVIQEINRIHGSEMKIEQLTQDESYIELWIPMGKEHWITAENVDFINTDELAEDEFMPELNVSTSEAPIVVETTEELEDLETIPDSKLKLLIIEDNTDIRFYMKIIFSNLYQVFLAENGQEGVEVARRELPNLILTDVMMPVMDGFECLRVLKEDFRTCHIPVIILTALTSDEDIVKGTDLGADDYILKPFNPEVLRAKVKRLMRSRVELKQIYTKLLTSATPSSAHQDEEIIDATTPKVEDPLIEKIVELVKANLQNPEFNVKSLADMLFMSQPTLYRKVKQITGFTIIELVRGVRLKEAAELLKTKQYGIQEVSEMVGYNDVPTFRKHFVSLYGTTPSTFVG